MSCLQQTQTSRKKRPKQPGGVTASTVLDLVKADKFEFARHVDPGWTDTEDSLFLQPCLCVDSANRHGCRQCRWNHYSDDVQGTDDYLA